MSSPIISIKNVVKKFPAEEGKRALHVLDDINLCIHEGEFLVLLGPSGCGKSTLLRIVSGLDTASKGEIEYHQKFNLDEIGFVFQNFGLLPWLSVSENVELGLIGRNVAEHIRKQKVSEILEHFGLASFAHSRPVDLSGGMKQRVGLARAFVTEPKIIFLDEPFSELDFFTARDLRRALLSMWQKKGTTIIMVSHYIDEAVELSDRIVVFSERPGKIIEIVKNDLPRDRNHRSKEFFEMEDKVLSYFNSAI